MSRTPNYILNVPHSVDNGPHAGTMLPEGSFVRPISDYYLPDAIKDHHDYKYYDRTQHTYCYTKYGIIKIPNYRIKEL